MCLVLLMCLLGNARLNIGLASANRCGQRSIKLPSNCLFTVEAIWSSYSQEQPKQTSFGVLGVWRKFMACCTERILQEDRGFRSSVPCLTSCFDRIRKCDNHRSGTMVRSSELSDNPVSQNTF